MMIYSIIFSLPVIILLLLNIKTFSLLYTLLDVLFKRNLRTFVLLLIFFAKAPIYLLHFWLPKAHVEAPTLGSIILARFILKIGPLGAIKIVRWIKFRVSNSLSYFITSLFVVRRICLCQSDFKKLIALTSVIHIGIRLSLLLTPRGRNLKGILVINFNHSLRSAIIFYFRRILMKISYSRIIYLQRYIKLRIITILVRLLFLLNIGVPPFYTFIGELIFFSSIILENFLFFIGNFFFVDIIKFLRIDI